MHTFTVTHQNMVPPFNEHLPYVLAYVELDEGPRVLTNIVGVDPAEVRIGQAVVADFATAARDDGEAFAVPGSGRHDPARMILDLHTHSVRSDDGRAKVDNYCQWIQRKELPLDGIVLTEHRQFDDESDYRALEDEYGLLILKASEVETDYGHVLVFGVNDDLRARVRLRPHRQPAAATCWRPPSAAAGSPCRAIRAGATSACSRTTTRRARSRASRWSRSTTAAASPARTSGPREEAERYGYRGIGGSDSHIVSRIGLCATEFDDDIATMDDLVDGPAGREMRGTDMAELDDGRRRRRSARQWVGRVFQEIDLVVDQRADARVGDRRAARPIRGSSIPDHPDFQASTAFPTHINVARMLPDDFPLFGSGRGIDGGKSIEWHRPMRAGDRLHADGADRRHLRQDGALGHDGVHRQPDDVLRRRRGAGRHGRLADDQAGVVTMRIEDVEIGDELPEERPGRLAGDRAPLRAGRARWTSRASPTTRRPGPRACPAR